MNWENVFGSILGRTRLVGNRRRSPASARPRREVPAVEPLEPRRLLTAQEFQVAGGTSTGLLQITPGPSDTVWYTEILANVIGSLTTSNPNPAPYSSVGPSTAPEGITLGPDGNIWYTEEVANKIGVVNLTETAPTPGALDTGPGGLTSGPTSITSANGDLWFTQSQTDQIGMLNPMNGDVTEYPGPPALATFTSEITLGPDGNLWFTESGAIGVFSPNGTLVTQITLPGGTSEFPFAITAGPDNTVWYTAETENSTSPVTFSYELGRIDVANGALNATVTQIPLSVAAAPDGVTDGPDGNIWFAVPSSGSTAGTIDEYNLSNQTIETTAISTTYVTTPDPMGITTGPDGNLWFTDSGGAIGQVVLPTQLAVTAQPPPDVSVGGTFGVTISDKYTTGTPDNDFDGTVSLALASDPTVSIAHVSAVNGVATFTGLSLPAGTYSLIASSSATNGPASVTTNSFTVVNGPATRLMVTTQPPTSPITAGSPFEVAVTDEYVSGPTDTSFTGSVSLALSTDLGTPIATTSAVGGVATFSDLTVDTAGSNYTLQATGGGLAAVNTDPFTVAPAAASHFVVTTEPLPQVTAGSPFGFAVTAYDPYNNVATGFSGTVTAVIVDNPTGGVVSLGGSVHATVSDGVATFSGLTLTKAAVGYTLEATSAGVSTSPTSSITIVAAAANHLVVTAGPPGSVPAGSSFGLTVEALDPYNNLDTTFNSGILIAIAPGANPGNGTLAGATDITASAGVATFSGLSISNMGNGYQFQISGDGLTVTTAPVNITAPIPTIILAQIVKTQKHNKKGKAVGKPMFAGFEFEYSTAMGPSAATPSEYVVDMTVIKRIKRKNVPVLKPVAFTTTYNQSTNIITLNVSSKQTFPKGGQITIIGTPPGGVASSLSVLLNGGTSSTFTIEPKLKGIVTG